MSWELYIRRDDNISIVFKCSSCGQTYKEYPINCKVPECNGNSFINFNKGYDAGDIIEIRENKSTWSDREKKDVITITDEELEKLKTSIGAATLPQLKLRLIRATTNKIRQFKLTKSAYTEDGSIENFITSDVYDKDLKKALTVIESVDK